MAMNTDVRTRISRIARTSSAAALALAAGVAWAQQPLPPAGSAEAKARQEARQEDRAEAKEKIDTAKGAKQGARENTRDAREGARDTAREGRQDTRNTREAARDTTREGRQTIRETRRDVRAARRQFLASRIRSGDLGLWVRRAANGLMVSDVANRGAIAQTGLKEGDEIVSVNGQPVMSERQFVDQLFADHPSNKPVPVVINRNGQQQTVSIQPKLFVDEHLAADDTLHEYGLILDESDPAHVKVQSVVPRSPAFYAGLKSGDQITGFGGQRVAALTDFIRSIASAAGGTTSVQVNRNNQPRQLEIDIPDENAGDEPRTAAKPVLPNTPDHPQAPANIQPRLNPPQ